MKREYKFFLNDILEAVDSIHKFSEGLNFDSFKRNKLIVDACVRNIEIVAEAIKNIPIEVKNDYPDIPWSKVIGFRNMVIHQYWVIDKEILWDIIQTKLESLKEQISDVLEKEKKLKRIIK